MSECWSSSAAVVMEGNHRCWVSGFFSASPATGVLLTSPRARPSSSAGSPHGTPWPPRHPELLLQESMACSFSDILLTAVSGDQHTLFCLPHLQTRGSVWKYHTLWIPCRLWPWSVSCFCTDHTHRMWGNNVQNWQNADTLHVCLLMFTKKYTPYSLSANTFTVCSPF